MNMMMMIILRFLSDIHVVYLSIYLSTSQTNVRMYYANAYKTICKLVDRYIFWGRLRELE